MTLNAGFNSLYPTEIYLGNIKVEEEYVTDALSGYVGDRLLNEVTIAFDKYLNKTVEKTIDDWDFEIKAWVNNYNNEMMPVHTHHGSQLSAVVYLMNEGDGGEISFLDPRGFAARGYDMSFRPLFDQTVFKPQPGDVLVFPSFMYHGVNPTKGKRISIPFDLYLQDLD